MNTNWPDKIIYLFLFSFFPSIDSFDLFIEFGLILHQNKTKNASWFKAPACRRCNLQLKAWITHVCRQPLPGNELCHWALINGFRSNNLNFGFLRPNQDRNTPRKAFISTVIPKIYHQYEENPNKATQREIYLNI